jgi:hypothetical protein
MNEQLSQGALLSAVEQKEDFACLTAKAIDRQK